MDKFWEIESCEPGFEGFFTLNKYRYRHRLFNGAMSPVIEREILERGHAVAVLPYDPINDTVLLIEQFRPGAIRNNQGPWLYEFTAGIVEAGENEEDVVRREALEEAAIELTDVHYITTFYPSPGGSSETIALYWASVDLSRAGGNYGLASEGEDIRASVHRYDDVFEMLGNGTINNSPSMILLLWFDRIRRDKFG